MALFYLSFAHSNPFFKDFYSPSICRVAAVAMRRNFATKRMLGPS